MKTINWKNAVLAGLAGTVLFDLFGLVMTGQWWDIPGILGEKTGLGLAYGVLGHYGNGVLLAILYSGLAPSLLGPGWLRPFMFITVQTIVLVWLFMFPLLGAGVGGINLGGMMPVVSMIRHWVFVIPFIFILRDAINPAPKIS